MADQPVCELCGEPMPPGEEMFKFHGCSGPCPVPIKPLSTKHVAVITQRDELLEALKDLVGVFEIRDFVRPEVARARQVIARVEGK